MFRFIDNNLRKSIIISVALLVCISYIFLPSIAQPINKVSAIKVLATPLVGLFVSILLYYFLIIVKKEELKNKNFEYISIILIILMFIALILSPSTAGVKRWIRIAGFNIQPSEVIKPLLILILAKALIINDLTKKYAIYIFSFSCSIAVFLLRAKTSSIQIFLIVFAMIVLLEKDKKSVIYTWIFSFLGFIMGLLYIYSKSGYSQKRLDAFKAGGASQAKQAVIAIKNGGIFGKGVGNGVQKYYYLSEAHNDFVFASITEEGGIIIAIILLIIFSVLIYSMASVILNLKDKYLKALSLGCMVALTNQILIHIGINLNLLPTTGITLPFIGYGGSASISNFSCVAIILYTIQEELRENNK